MIPLWNIFCVSWGSFIWVLYPKWLPPNNGDDNLTYNGCGLLSMISCLSISSKERKMGMLTFHNMIWNAPCIQSVLNCLWGEPLRRIYVRSVILLNCQNIDNGITRMSLYYWVFSDETKRGNNESELCALLCLDRTSRIVSHTNARIVLPYFGMLNRKINFMPLPCIFTTGCALGVSMK